MRAVDDGHGVDEAFELDLRWFEESHDHAGRHGVANPLAHEEVLAAAVERDLGALGVGGDRLDLRAQLWRHALVGVEVEDPRVTEVDVCHRPILVCGPVVEGTLDNAGALSDGDLLGGVLAEAVEHDDVVEAADRVEAGADIRLFVEREDEDRDLHVGSLILHRRG